MVIDLLNKSQLKARYTPEGRRMVKKKQWEFHLPSILCFAFEKTLGPLLFHLILLRPMRWAEPVITPVRDRRAEAARDTEMLAKTQGAKGNPGLWNASSAYVWQEAWVLVPRRPELKSNLFFSLMCNQGELFNISIQQCWRQRVLWSLNSTHFWSLGYLFLGLPGICWIQTFVA